MPGCAEIVYIKGCAGAAGEIWSALGLIASLDDSNETRSAKWQSERSKAEKEYQEALAKRDRTELRCTARRIEQARMRNLRWCGKTSAVQLHAPFDGVLISGDLSQSLGAPVPDQSGAVRSGTAG